MATQPISSRTTPDVRDESRWERVDGRWIERPMRGRDHAQIQWNVTAALKRYAERIGGEAHQEWSVVQPETASSDDPDYMTPDVLVLGPIRTTARGHLIPPGFLAVEVVSPEQDGLIEKVERLHAWGITHCWIIYPQTRLCLEYHGGNQILIAREELSAGELRVSVAELFQGVDD